MKQDSLLHKLAKEFNITEAESSLLVESLKVKEYKKGDLILKQGEIDTHVKFILSGIVHQYIIVEGEIYTIDISLSDMYFNSYKSYVNNSPSNEIHEAVSDVQILFMEKKEVNKLLKQYNWYCYAYMKSQEKILVERENRSFILQHKDAFMRIKLFMSLNENSNRYYQEVTDKLLAKYLAMTPESFSKAKKKYFKS